MKLRELLARRIDEKELTTDTEQDDLTVPDTGGGDEPTEEPAAEEPAPKEEKPKEEEPEVPSTIDELFDANTDKVKEYSPIQTWDAKKLVSDTVIIANGKRTKAKAGQYVIRNHKDIKQFRLVDEDGYNKQYAQVRQSDKQDAEGFILVKEVGNVKAFQHDGDDLSVKNGKNEDVDVKEGQYVVKYTDEKKSGWSVDANEFEKVYKVRKH